MNSRQSSVASRQVVRRMSEPSRAIASREGVDAPDESKTAVPLELGSFVEAKLKAVS